MRAAAMLQAAHYDHTLARAWVVAIADQERQSPVPGQYLAGSTGTGKSHLAIAIARACIRGGARGRFYTVVDLVNRLENEARADRQGRLAEYLTRMDLVVLDELGYLPFAQPAASCSSIWSAGSTSGLPSSSPPISPSANGRACSATPR